MTHTKGPWSFRTAPNGDNGIYADGTGVFIETFAEIRHSGENAREEALANAHLVCAAPDLLRVAELLVSWLDEEEGAHKLCDAARSAIAKATGGAA